MVIIGAYVGVVTTEAESSVSNTYLMRKSKEHNPLHVEGDINRSTPRIHSVTNGSNRPRRKISIVTVHTITVRQHVKEVGFLSGIINGD